jgi:hypothetical protein
LWHVGDAREDVGEPGFRVDVVETRRHDERRHYGGSLGTPIGAGEHAIEPIRGWADLRQAINAPMLYQHKATPAEYKAGSRPRHR